MRAVFGDHTSRPEPDELDITDGDWFLVSFAQPVPRLSLPAALHLVSREVQERLVVCVAEQSAWGCLQAEQKAEQQLQQVQIRQALGRLALVADESHCIAGLAQQFLVMVRQVVDVPTTAMPYTSQPMPLPAARWFPLVLHSGLTVTVGDPEIDDHQGDLQLVTTDLHQCFNDIRPVNGASVCNAGEGMPLLIEARIPELTFETGFLNHSSPEQTPELGFSVSVSPLVNITVDPIFDNDFALSSIPSLPCQVS